LCLVIADDSNFCQIVQNNVQLDTKYRYMLSGYVYTGNVPSYTTITFSNDGAVAFDVDYAKWNNTIIDDVQSSDSLIYEYASTSCTLNDENNLN
jgi:hypothetical protein